MGNMPTAAQFMKNQLGIEATWGTEVDATIALSAIDITPGPKVNTEAFTAKGHILPAVLSYGMDWNELGFEGKATREDMQYFIKSIPVAAYDGLGTGGAGSNEADSYTVEAGGLTFAGGLVQAWTLRGNANEVAVAGNILASVRGTNAATAALTPPTQHVFLNDHVTISIGGSAVANALEWELSVADIWELAHFVGSDLAGGACQGPLNAVFNMAMEADAANLARIVGDRTSQEIIITLNDGGGNTCTITFDGQAGEPEPMKAFGRVYGYGLRYHVMSRPSETNHIDVVYV